MSVEELYPELRKARRAALAFVLACALLAMIGGAAWLLAQISWAPFALMLGGLVFVLSWMIYIILRSWNV